MQFEIQLNYELTGVAEPETTCGRSLNVCSSKCMFGFDVCASMMRANDKANDAQYHKLDVRSTNDR